MWLRERIKEYIEYFENEEWQYYTDTKFPEVIFVAPDEKSKDYLKRQIRKQLDYQEISFILTTWDEFAF